MKDAAIADGDIWEVIMKDGSKRYAYDEDSVTNIDSRLDRNTGTTDMNKMGLEMLQDAATSHVLHSMGGLINLLLCNVFCLFLHC